MNKERMLSENVGGYWEDAAEAKKCQRLPTNHQKLTERHRAVFLTDLRRNFSTLSKP